MTTVIRTLRLKGLRRRANAKYVQIKWIPLLVIPHFGSARWTGSKTSIHKSEIPATRCHVPYNNPDIYRAHMRLRFSSRI